MAPAGIEVFEGSSTGKVILLGEHAVVHGVPALAASIGRGAWACAEPARELPQLQVGDASGPWNVDEDSDLLRAYRILNDVIGVTVRARARIDIPTRAGLGSSACLGVALARALMRSKRKPFDDDDVMQAATAWERVFHGNPSGIDVAVATHGGCLEFSRSKGVRRIDLSMPIPLCVGDTGTRSSTRQMVEHVAKELGAQADGGRAVLEGIGACVARAGRALPEGDWAEVGCAMRDNQRWLKSLGLINAETEKLCAMAHAAGALAAKVTGAGGGGCVIALAPGKQSDVLEAWHGSGFQGFAVDAGE